MEDPAEPKFHVEVPPVIGYAEPSTHPRLSAWQWLARRWLPISAKILLVSAMMFIGGTVGTMNFDFEPALPWEGSLIVRHPMHQTPLANPMSLAQFHDLITPDWIEQSLSKSYYKDFRLGTAEIRRRIDVSSLDQDRSFTITIQGKSNYDCDDLSGEFGDLLRQYGKKQGIRLEIAEEFARRTEAAKLAPTLDTLAGVGIGIIVAVIIIRISGATSNAPHRSSAP